MMPSAAAKSRDHGRPCEQKGMRSKPSPSDTVSLWRLFSSVTPVSFPDGTAQDPFLGRQNGRARISICPSVSIYIG